MNQANNILRRADETTADILAVMINKESSVYHCQDYLLSSSEVTADDRKQLVDWCFRIVDICSFQRETVAIAANLLDRFLSIPSSFATEFLQDRREFQLLALSCLYIAIKTNESVAFSSVVLSAISRGGYSVEEIEETEKIVLYWLSWRVNPPTSLQMALHILSLMGLNELMSQQSLIDFLNEVQHQTEKATQDYRVSIQRPSTVALTILIKAFQQLEYNTRIELFTSLLPVLEAFDFDNKFKRSTVAGIDQSESRLPAYINVPSCESITSDDSESLRTVPGSVSIRSIDKL